MGFCLSETHAARPLTTDLKACVACVTRPRWTWSFRTGPVDFWPPQRQHGAQRWLPGNRPRTAVVAKDI